MRKAKPEPSKRVYWDACVFLSLIEGDQMRLPVIEALIDEAKKGTLEIWTSTLSIAEVAFAKSEKDGKALDEDILRKINKLWRSPSPFKLVEVHRGIVNEAQAYVRNSILFGSIKPPDAIHLVSAKKAKASEFHTYDDFKGKREEVQSLAGIIIKEPKAIGLVFNQ